MRQKRVLLRLVETVDLVHEQNRLASVARSTRGCVGHDRSDFLHAGQHGRKRNEHRTGPFRDDPRQRRLAASRRTPEYKRRQAVGRYRLTQEPVFAKHVSLTDEVLE